MKEELVKIAEQGRTLLLKIAIFLIGITVLGLCLIWLPWQAMILEDMYPEFVFLKLPLLIGIYLTTIPFFFALYKGIKLLSYIDKNQAFSERSVKSLRSIKVCAITISLLYVLGMMILISVNAGNPGILLLGLVITFASIVIAVFSAVLQMLLKSGMDLKAENDLMV
ncbi:DUF2975 domain-containing protein [Alkalihalobacillus sp. MEB130]|uniref:DUF2975 domain-containing protein n=1 Tax=Alkalihalobacillus sp. MEB130 TaxID=2976704 RepID=UPI0028DD6087|nr:DUF2975 domain-containing protein [Alkalihalobacillus sp. MEB130]MDT8863046.1 DUF2975 domain-containing protein [Alkalihalobacillus sp. MEB130]